MKKSIFLIVIITVLSFALASCGGDSQGNAGSDSEYINLPKSTAQIEGLEEFKTLDLDGKEVDESIFKGHKVTMVKVWMTTCPPCIASLQQNERVYQKFKDRGFNVVGLVIDTIDQSSTEEKPIAYRDAVDEANAILADKGVTFTNVVPPFNSFYGIVGYISTVPAYFYVNEKGEVIKNLGGPISYEERVKEVEALLAD